MATAFSATAGNFTPSATPATLTSNYIDFTSDTTKGWAQQYLPDLMEQEAEIFGNRTIGGFLEMVGAEEPMTSDQVVWSEQGRLHLSYLGNTAVTSAAGGSSIVFTIVQDIDGATVAGHGIRVGDLVIISDPDIEVHGYVSAVGTLTATVIPLKNQTDLSSLTNVSANETTVSSIMVYGSEYGKGTSGRTKSLKQEFKSLTNNPLILKDMYEVSGSDASQIGWVEISGEDGQAGYMWYLKAAGDTRMRFTDYLEMTMLEHQKVTDQDTGTAGTQLIDDHASNSAGYTGLQHGANLAGSEGMFEAIRTRGNVFDGLLDTTAGSWSGTNFRNDVDAILKEFDKQGAIEEYMIFGGRGLMLAFDDFLAAQNSYGSGGTSYGVFDNDEDMALNLGFSGFRRGSYDFYKSDWKYLNDKATRGGIVNAKKIRAAFVPAGVTSVYDQQLGKNLKRPFLHVRYRASQMEDRRFKTWTTGSVGAATNDLDAMTMHFLSERCLVTQGANNFMLVEGTGTY